MAYEKYKKILAKEEFYNNWETDQLVKITNDIRTQIYDNYVAKAEVLQRDNFTCQNEKCNVCHNQKEYAKLTVHHIKARRNKGSETKRNKVTVCNGSHQRYERAKGELKFNKDVANLPPHIRGHTFRLKRPDNINWKKIKAEMRILRKGLKGIDNKIKWEDIEILLKWLLGD